MILVVATRRSVPFVGDVQARKGFTKVGTRRVAWLDFQRWIAPIPLEERAEDSIVYKVFRKEGAHSP